MNDRLAAAKLWLVCAPAPSPGGGRPAGPAPAERPRDLPYLAHALYALTAVESSEVATMTVDERWRLSVNPAWLACTDVPDVARVLAHLVWHLLADHAGRARDQGVARDTWQPWAVATDVAVHGTLVPDGLGGGLPTAGQRGLVPGRSAEEYFATLSRLPAALDADVDGTGGSGARLGPEDGCGSGADGIPRSHELGAAADDDPRAPGLSPQDAHHVRRLVAAELVEHARRRGTRPGDASRWAAAVLEPSVAWEPLLAQAVRRAVGYAAGRGEPTYSRLSRRRSPGVVLPGQRRPVPRVAVVVDTSGSVDDALLARALGEVDGVLRAVGVGAHDVTVSSVDAAVQTVQRVRRARDVALAGGGGTDMRVGLRAAAAARPRPDVVVVLTDGWTPWPADPPPGCSVVVALLGREGSTPPPVPSWATRVDCRLE